MASAANLPEVRAAALCLLNVERRKYDGARSATKWRPTPPTSAAAASADSGPAGGRGECGTS